MLLYKIHPALQKIVFYCETSDTTIKIAPVATNIIAALMAFLLFSILSMSSFESSIIGYFLRLIRYNNRPLPLFDEIEHSPHVFGCLNPLDLASIWTIS